MSALAQYIRLRILLVIFLIFYFLYAVLSFRQFGITFDERDVYLRGKLFYSYARGGDKVIKNDLLNPNSRNEMGYYNNVYPAFLYAVNGSESYEGYHLLNLLFASLIFVFAYELLLAETGKPLLAFLGPLFVLLTPRFFGDIPANPKDMPFAVFYFIAAVLIFLTAKWDRRVRLLLLGVAFGLAQSQRFAGYTLYPAALIFELSNKKRFSRTLIDLLVVFVIGFLIHMLSVPYLAADPVGHFFELARMTVGHPWNNTLLFMGNTYSARQEPVAYALIWFLFTVPLIQIPLFTIGLSQVRKMRSIRLLAVVFGINLVILAVTRPVLYDGIRHLMYLLPLFSVAAALGLVLLLRKGKKWVFVLLLGLIINFGFILHSYVSLHPYEYLYFNELTGGTRGAYGKFDMDYWGASYREAALWLDKYVKDKPGNSSDVYACGTSFASAYYFSDKIKLADNPGKADYAVCWDRFSENKQIKGSLIFTVQKDGIPLNYVYEINHEKKD